MYLLPSSILNDFGECLLQVTEDHIRLLRLADISQEIAAWPLISLRKYGRDETKFTFECGRFVVCILCIIICVCIYIYILCKLKM